MNEPIKQIQIGEIVRVEGDNRDWILTEVAGKNGTLEWLSPRLVLLEKLLMGYNKKVYYKRKGIALELPPTKKFLTKKLTNIKRRKK